LDDLLAQVESLQNSVTIAYNDAAKVEADSTINAVQIVVATYKAMTYPSQITHLSTAVTTAESAISTAESSRNTHYTAKTLPKNLDALLNDLSGIETLLLEAKAAADKAYNAALGELEKTTYNTYKETIKSISDSITDYKEGKYAAKLTELIDTAKVKVEAATAANENALAVLYENGTEAVDDAIAAARVSLQAIKNKVADLEAHTPDGIVKALLKDAQALVPLYNRAEANAKGDSEAEKECKDIYAELTTLLATLQPDENAEKYNEILEGIAADKDSYTDQISKLKTRIIAADLEQKAYNELLASLADPKDTLEVVKDTIQASEFKIDLESEFNATITEIENALSAAEQNINIDHANNLCGKKTATVKAEDIAAISARISKLSEDVTAKVTVLAKDKADAATRAHNISTYNSAKTAIDNVKKALGTAWENAQNDNKDVFTLFSEEVGEENGKTGLYGQINSLFTSLDEAYEAAQNEGGNPSKLNTDNITSSVNEITSSIEDLMTRISNRQAQYNTDVETLNANIEEMKTSYKAVEISDIAAADEDVQDKKAAIDAAIAAIYGKMENLGPNDIEDVQGQIDAANALIEELRELAAGKTYIPGDIDSDGKVDVLDLAVIRDLVSGKTDSSTLDENQQKAADMDADGEYTVADFVQVNNVYVYGNKLGQNKAVAKAAMKNQTEPGSVAMQMDTANMDVMLNSTVGYAAIQMDVTLPEGVSITEVEFSGESKSVMMTANMLDNGACRLMLYTVNSSNLLNGENRLLNLKLAGEGTGVVSIDRIIASTGAGQRHDLESVTGAYTIVTGIEAVEASEASKTSIFDINGMVRKTMQKGVNIVKDAAGKVKKILVK
ncbi:MAG: dockerin type I repeat-containing protein, partial [Treponema sp.]|nr:dockerin type I repeat-containing protein [Treponema sp.]